jgi:hypothetical protein
MPRSCSLYERPRAKEPALRMRPKSVFEEVPMVNLDCNERIRLKVRFRALAHGSWAVKAKGKHRGIISRTAEAVFEAFRYLTERDGRVFPSL